MEKMFYTISQTAEILEETVVTVRFWSNNFNKFLAPRRNAKGNRLYTPKDIEVLKQIRYLTRDCGLSLEATARKLSMKGSEQDKSMAIRDSLLRIKEQLEQIKGSL